MNVIQAADLIAIISKHLQLVIHKIILDAYRFIKPGLDRWHISFCKRIINNQRLKYYSHASIESAFSSKDSDEESDKVCEDMAIKVGNKITIEINKVDCNGT